MFHPPEIKSRENDTRWKRFINRIIYIVALFGPIVTIPQVVKIWINRDATDISILTWASYFIFSLVWISYGIIHDEKPITIRYLLYSILYLMVVIAAILFGSGDFF
jgi:uncharacterized protein with PQ loop repeat